MWLLLRKVSISTVVGKQKKKNDDCNKGQKKKKGERSKKLVDLIRVGSQPCELNSSVKSAAIDFTESGRAGSSVT
jgi:hypothetical protein